MVNEKDWIALGFSRQKRGLIIMSVILLFLHYAKPDFSDASLRLFQIHFGNPEVIWIVIWAIFWFFLYRWFQYFYQKGISEIRNSFLLDFVHFAQSNKDKLYSWASDQAEKEGSSEEAFNLKSRLRLLFYVYQTFDESGREAHLREMSVERQANGDEAFQVPLKLVFVPICRAGLRTVFMRPMFIEEFFPIILAAITILIYAT